MEISPLFDYEKVFLLAYLVSKLSQEVEICYVHFVEVLDVLGGGDSRLFSLISPPYSSKVVIFWSIFLIFLIFLIF